MQAIKRSKSVRSKMKKQLKVRKNARVEEARDTGECQSQPVVSEARQRLESAQFRWINEQLYTTTGKNALKMFKEEPESFEAYHTGFRNQVSKWPINPLNVIIEKLQSTFRNMSTKKRSQKITVADLGCGEARLGAELTGEFGGFVTVKSFDLVAANDTVTACDISNLPLEAKSVDFVVFCLSLMGTNYIDFLREAVRVMRWGSTLLIAEVESRFVSVDKFVDVLKKLGFSNVEKIENRFFHLFEFKKTDEVELSKHQRQRIQKLGPLILKPCRYKKR